MQPSEGVLHPPMPTVSTDAEALAALLDVSERLLLCRDTASVTQVVRTAVRRLTGADGATVVLRDGDLCHYVDEDAISPLWKGKRFPMRTCISGWSMLTGEPAAIPDIYADARIPADAYRLTFVRSLVMVPVGAPEPMAAIGAYWARLHAPDGKILAWMQTLARSVGRALSTVRQFESLQENADHARRAAETAQARAAELTRTNAARARLLATVSHDLRQPINALALLTAALAQHSTEEGRTYLARMERCLDGVRGLLNGALDLSRIELGTITPQIEEVAPNDLLAHVEAIFRPVAEAKGLHWRIEAPCGDRPVRTDRVLATRILSNFVDNAIKFTERGEVRLRCRNTGHTLWIDVSDTGHGIPEDAIETIFEEFHRLNGEKTGNGLGLGLSIVKAMADLLGHRIAVDSRVGLGSTFSVGLRLD